MLKYAFYDARTPMVWAGEFPADFYQAEEPRTDAQNARAYEHVYNNRWKELWPHILAVAKLMPLAGAVLGDDVAAAVERLARKARELRFIQEQDVKQKRDGAELVRGYGDQAFVQKVKQSVLAEKGSSDSLSTEFEQEFSGLERLLAPHMG